MELKKINLHKVKAQRAESIHLRKNILLSVSIAITITASLIYTIVNIDPDVWWAKPLFFILVFVDCFYIMSIIFAKRRRGLISAFVITLYLLLRFLGITESFYLVALATIGVIFELIIYYKER